MENETELVGKRLFEKSLEEVQRIINLVAWRNHLDPTEREDFGSYVLFKLIEHGYRKMRKFRGESRLQTYLRVVVQRLFLDFRAANWGKWRASPRARSLGRAGVMLEQFLYRDGMARDEAGLELQARGFHIDGEELDRMVELLPYRARRRRVSLDILDQLPKGAEARALSAAERTLTAERFEAAFSAAACDLGAEDRLVLKLKFVDGATVSEIAAALGSCEASVNLRLARLIRRLRKRLEARGLDRAAARTIWSERIHFDLESALEKAGSAASIQQPRQGGAGA